MIEINLTYDLLPGTDQKAYAEFAKKTIGVTLQAPGLVEFRANRNLCFSSSQVRITTVWQTLSDWADFVESATWQALEFELRTFTTNNRIEIWGPSLLVPEPIRPSR